MNRTANRAEPPSGHRSIVKEKRNTHSNSVNRRLPGKQIESSSTFVNTKKNKREKKPIDTSGHGETGGGPTLKKKNIKKKTTRFVFLFPFQKTRGKVEKSRHVIHGPFFLFFFCFFFLKSEPEKEGKGHRRRRASVPTHGSTGVMW